jgi:hypothetical protein
MARVSSESAMPNPFRRPIKYPYLTRYRRQIEWKVPRIKRDSSFSPMSFASRSRISRLALIVNVQHMTSCGWYPWWERRYATRAVKVLVLPEPGGASTCRIEPDEVTASRCAWFRPSRMGSMTCWMFGSCSSSCEGETRRNAASCDMFHRGGRWRITMCGWYIEYW